MPGASETPEAGGRAGPTESTHPARPARGGHAALKPTWGRRMLGGAYKEMRARAAFFFF